MRIGVLCRICCVAATVILGCGTCGAQSIKLAVITSLSGPFALSGDDAIRQFRGIADLINARGGVLPGRPLEIVAFDGKATPQDSLLALKQAADQDITFVTTHVSSVAHALSDAITKNNERNPDRRMLLLTFDARDPALTEQMCSFWHFRFIYHTDSDVNFLADYLVTQPKARKVYLLNQDYAYGQSVSRAARETLGRKRPDIQIVGDDMIPLGKVKDFAPYIAKIRAADADSIITGNWGNDLSLFVRAAHEAGLNARFYTFVAYSVGVASAIGSAGADRVWGVFPSLANAPPNPYEKYNAEFKTKYKSPKNFDYAPVYRIAEMLTAAVAKVQSTDALKVARALEGMRYAGFGGEAWMRAEDHQIVAPLYLASFVKAGQPGVRFDVEDTGYGWRLEGKAEAKDAVPAIKCAMRRP